MIKLKELFRQRKSPIQDELEESISRAHRFAQDAKELLRESRKLAHDSQKVDLPTEKKDRYIADGGEVYLLDSVYYAGYSPHRRDRVTLINRKYFPSVSGNRTYTFALPGLREQDASWAFDCVINLVKTRGVPASFQDDAFMNRLFTMIATGVNHGNSESIGTGTNRWELRPDQLGARYIRDVVATVENALNHDRVLRFCYTPAGESLSQTRRVQVRKLLEDGFLGEYERKIRRYKYDRCDEAMGELTATVDLRPELAIRIAFTDSQTVISLVIERAESLLNRQLRSSS